jgi:hypothetical protein
MSFFDFFKKKKRIETETEISFLNLDLFIKNRYSNYEKESNFVKREIKEKINNLISELVLKKNYFKEVNLENRKEEEKLKRIVLENISIYVTHLEKLITDLKNLEDKLTTEDYIKKIQSVFNNFKKSSEKSVEKATILVGKEFEFIKDILRNFSKQFNDIIIKSNEKFKEKTILEEINRTKEEYDYSERVGKEIDEKIKIIEKEKEGLEKEIIILEKAKENLKKSERYKRYQEELANQKKKKEDFNKKALQLKEKINLKLLLKTFHNNEKKYLLLKNYQDNFIKTFEKDKNLEIIELVKEGLRQDLENEIKGLRQDLEKINQEMNHEVKNKEEGIQEKINKKNNELSDISKQIESEEKKILKFVEKKKEILIEIENILKSINLKLIQ